MPQVQLRDPEPDSDRREDRLVKPKEVQHHAFDSFSEAMARAAEATARLGVAQFSHLMEAASAWLGLADRLSDRAAEPPRVGKYLVDYSEVTPEELAKPDPAYEELLKHSRPVSR